MNLANADKPMWSVGLMTGTVLDGNIDVAMIKTNGEQVLEFGPAVLARYKPDVMDLLRQSLEVAQQWQFEGPEPVVFREAERALTTAQTTAVQQLVKEHGFSMKDIGVVGFHGQTVLHRRPLADQPGRTRQLGDGQWMAEQLQVPVVYDFRSADVESGGQGAPLAPVYHSALMQRAGLGSECALLNLGGVANITWRDRSGELIAFDTGPANAPLNDFVRSLGLGEMDKNGELASRGKVDEDKLRWLLKHPYLNDAYPKSLDRFDFSASMADGYSAEDGAALLTAFTCAAVGFGLDKLPERPTKLVVCGGGRHNPVLMKELANRAAVEVIPSDSIGIRGDMVEAECFAFLAVRVLRELPISFPKTTGVVAPMSGGLIARPAI
ncbi:MAG: anhydro-N-acetylmuramic acid kinase [Granulosicoccus sp.]|nr:anhydro-N-acetylmuramic acid kinase [Granulosicoccus sp.]